MHAYLAGIGLSNIKTGRAMEFLMEEVVERHSKKAIFHTEDGRLMAEFSRYYARNAGVTVCGEIDEVGDFRPEYAFPFYTGDQISLCEDVSIEPQTVRDAYAGACDDMRIGITIIFYLSNMGEYRSLADKGLYRDGKKSVILSGIAMNGSVLLPVYHRQELEKIRREAAVNRKKLMNAARDGDEEAIESLTMEDMDTYSLISRRLQREDIMSIVESYFMPCGVECDQYNILGTIRHCETTQNGVTGDRLYQMAVDVNDVIMNVCINAKDLLGVPEPGRRFKGRVWLQGKVLFHK